MTDVFDAGRAFILREGRLLERRLLGAMFEGAPTAGVIDALRGYQNDDGGFGHGLEPDKRCPHSLPADVEVALQVLDDAGTTDDTMVRQACDFLVAVGRPDGAVPLAFPTIEAYPRAEHWSEWTYTPGVFPTAGLVGLLHKLGADHPWIGRATTFCWASLDDALPDDAHALREVLVFLEHAPDRARADALVPAVAEQLPKANWFRADPTDPSYGLSPLEFAPEPDSRWRSLFADDVIEAHLDRLQGDQQPDGGWPVTWEPPSGASMLEWRGSETLKALQILTAYGRL